MTITTGMAGSERPTEEPSDTGTTSGGGGDIMFVWDSISDLSERIDRVYYVREEDITNASSFGLWVAGVFFPFSPMSGSTKDFDSQLDSETKSGSGGGVMFLWSLDGAERVDYAINLPSNSIKNATGFPLWVSGINIIEGSMDGSTTGLGATVRGRLRDKDISSIGGSVTFVDDSGGVLGQIAVEGEYRVVAPPPDGVTSGSNSDFAPIYNAIIQPSNGLEQFIEDAPSKGFISLVYARATGSVSDVNGNGLDNEAVSINGTGFTTNPDGEYTALLPHGETLVFQALKGSSTKERSITDGNAPDFQYSGVKLVLTAPGGVAVPNAITTLSGATESVLSNGSGEALFATVPPGVTATATVYGSVERSVTSSSEGSIAIEQITFGLGVRGNILSNNGFPVSSVDIRAVDQSGKEFPVTTTAEGGYSIGVPSEGSLDIIVSQDDRRFTTSQVTVGSDGGNVIDYNFELEERENIGTTV